MSTAVLEHDDDALEVERGSEWLKSDPVFGAKGVDTENHVINGYVVAQLGRFKTPGRGEFTDESLNKIVALGNSSPKGLKSRFTHPDESNDGLGTLLGRSKNFRLDGKKVRADLHLDPTSLKPPPGGGGRPYGEYVEELAQTDPAAFSSSLVLKVDRKYRINEDGTRKRDKEGNVLPPIWMPTELHASDAVDTGDAVDDFMSANLSSGTKVHVVSGALDRLFKGLTRKEIREKCAAYVDRYLDRRFDGDDFDDPENGDDDMTPDELKAALAEQNKSIVEGLGETITGAFEQLGAKLAPKEEGEKEPTPEELAAEQAKQVRALCSMAGCNEDETDQLLGFVNGGLLNLDQLKEQLHKKLFKDNTIPPGEPDPEVGQRLSEFKREFREHLKIHQSLGVTEEDYIALRERESAGQGGGTRGGDFYRDMYLRVRKRHPELVGPTSMA